MKKIAIMNQKGGVGKSTLTYNIAHGLSLRNKKILLIDLDGQNDSSLFLGYSSEDSEDNNKTFFHLIDKRYPAKLHECIKKARHNLDLIPNSNISQIESEFNREARIDLLLNEVLKDLNNMDYDYVFFDSGPQRTKINDAILCYVDSIIMPVQVEAASVRATGNMYDYLSDLRLDGDKIKMIIPNMMDKRNNDAKENLDILKMTHEDSIKITSPIYRRVKITEAGKNGQSVFEYDKESEKMFIEVVKTIEEEI